MTSSEYLEWTKHAVAAFPAIHRVLDGSGEGRQRSRQWLAALGRISLQHATEAIDAMMRGEFEPPKYDWAELPAYVIRFGVEKSNAEAAQHTERYYEDGPTYKCSHCRDSRSGYVSVWNPWFLNDCAEVLLGCNSLFDVHKVFSEWRFATDGHKHETFAMACSCESPAAVAKRKDGRAYVFNPQRACLAGPVMMLHEFLRDEKRYEFNPDDWQ